MIPHAPGGFVGQASALAKEAKNEKLAMVYTGLAVTVMALMALHEVRDMFRDRRHPHGFDDRSRGR